MSSKCVQALTTMRNQEKELWQHRSPGVPHTEVKSDIIPHDMAVVTITENVHGDTRQTMFPSC